MQEFGYELPPGFGFRQHVTLSFDTKKKVVIEVAKRGAAEGILKGRTTDSSVREGDLFQNSVDPDGN
ncbi:hypothetical protein AB4516_21485 [Vibrio sp. 10N.222.54.F12]|uniref:hypothetical protein n=1 Tax=Vibrio TaxID=662 RepID=UPI000C840D8F|nr:MULTISPECIES: hypothetical protein [Vibrio]PMI17141.1 hypothetical protein BCU63_31110 [Vibrio splendidus]PMJ45307.1 hypothetical protein BCU23_26070 [Vibrio splendidus]PML18376.1 hypothetical protein BCT83_22315 [Vibrio tasmaniensis]PML45867.1 hypothetical protein BCT76_16150 [Vibrio tasmaniensis]UOE85034.1 hypothetical protein LTQ54_03170 [Vibrio splendidus]